jgi:hypothetical protein
VVLIPSSPDPFSHKWRRGEKAVSNCQGKRGHHRRKFIGNSKEI